MKSFWGIIPRYISKNKKRVSSIAICIVLSITLIMSLAIMEESFIKTLIQDQKDWLGAYYDIMVNTSNNKALDELKKDEVINDLSIILPLGNLKVENTKYSISLKGYDDNITNFLNVKFLEGRSPNSDNEIALEQWILNYIPKEYKVGDKIKFKYKLEYLSKEETEEVEKEFIIVGIFQYNSLLTNNSSESIGWVTRNFAENQLKNKKVQYDGFINLNSNYSINSGNLMLNNDGKYSDISFQPNNEKVSLLLAVKILDIACYILFAILGVVITINIYNIFAVSVIERKKQFGILRAMGASPHKVKALVIVEGIIIGIIFIPIGIIIGNTITKSMMIFLGYDELSSLLIMPKIGVISSIIIGVFSIIIGTYFPSKKAARVSPMEAINESEDVTFKRDELSIDNIKIWGKKVKFPSIIAIINIKRNKKKFITSVISLSMTILLLMSAYYLIKQADPIEKFKNSYGDADFKITSNNVGLKEKDIDKISDIPGVSILSKVESTSANIYVDKERITKDGISYLKLKSKENEIKQDMFEKGIYNFDISLFAYDEVALEDIKDKIIEGNVDNLNNEPTLIIAQNLNDCNYTNIKVGDEIEVNLEKYDDSGKKIGACNQVFKVGAILDNEKFNILDGRISISLILSNEIATQYLEMDGYNIINMTIDDDTKYEEAYSNLKVSLQKIREANLESFNEKYEELKKQNAQLSFILYSFIFIVATVSIINLINIMKINVITRSKEIGMLRAIGFGIDEVKQMIMIEGLLYGVVASILGCTLGTSLTYFIYKLSKHSAWSFPIINIIIISCATILVTTVSSMISSRHLFKTSIVDSIRSVE